MSGHDPLLMTAKEAAFRLGKSPDTVRDWLQRGRLEGSQVGGPGCAIQVTRESVNAALSFRFSKPR